MVKIVGPGVGGFEFIFLFYHQRLFVFKNKVATDSHRVKLL